MLWRCHGKYCDNVIIFNNYHIIYNTELSPLIGTFMEASVNSGTDSCSLSQTMNFMKLVIRLHFIS